MILAESASSRYIEQNLFDSGSFVLNEKRSNKHNTWKVTVKKGRMLKRASTFFLILATFFNPLGFDALFALVMKWTGSYWITDAIFYCLSAFFFGLYWVLSSKIKKKSHGKHGMLPEEQETFH
jgi:hypothetical protein